MKIYLDTSGLNYLNDNLTRTDLNWFTEKGVELHLSSATVWEILLNSNKDRRESLIYFGQKHCSSKLLKSSSEILIDYLNQGCPEMNRIAFWEDPWTKLDLGRTWTNIHGDIGRTIPVETQEIKDFSTNARTLSKKLKRILLEMSDSKYQNKGSDAFCKIAQQVALNNGLDVKEKNLSPFIISTILAFFLVCIGMDIDKSVIRNYWQKKGINDPLERLDYLVEEYPKYFARGPIAEMAKMVDVQIKHENSKSRGLLFDCFHIIYAYYTDIFFTNDKHFAKYRVEIDHIAFKNISLGSEIEEQFKMRGG